MEFKSLKNIEQVQADSAFGIVFLCLCALVSVFSVVASFRFAEKQREKIYVLDGGESLMLALSQDLSQNRPVEAREDISGVFSRVVLHPLARPCGHRRQHQPRAVPRR